MEDEAVPLTPIETQMFKTMARALSIPHFGYSHSVNVASLMSIGLCCNFNNQTDVCSEIHGDKISKLTALPFVKAISQAFLRHTR